MLLEVLLTYTAYKVKSAEHFHIMERIWRVSQLISDVEKLEADADIKG